ncbi:hypothetical protein AAG570_010451 [Ranatra chinensis]|uniref:Uncharacterized protein n=1 Tax=Ranatra chinensis TaxID=642074 RepID=A0ABD0YMK7_9HEMI
MICFEFVEEWIKRKKVEVVTKRQIATRVQREVVLEDGKVVQDSGPKVTTTTTEDTEKQESENTEVPYNVIVTPNNSYTVSLSSFGDIYNRVIQPPTVCCDSDR